MDFQKVFQDFNPAKFLAHICLVVFCCLLALRLDGVILWSFWAVFLPLWLWKFVIISAVVTAIIVWIRNPEYKLEVNSSLNFRALLICAALNITLLVFEVLLCDQLERQHARRWIFVFSPLVFSSAVSIGLVVWAIKNQRSFEMELFLASNLLQFIFLALRLDGFIMWSWKVVFIPLWVLMCVVLVGVLYLIILAVILACSSEVMAEQRTGSAHSAVGYTLTVVPLVIFEVLVTQKLEGEFHLNFIIVVLPLILSLLSLAGMAFYTKPANPWWFGVRKDFTHWLLTRCPLLQEYGNITFKRRAEADTRTVKSSRTPRTKPNADKQTAVPVVCIELPD